MGIAFFGIVDLIGQSLASRWMPRRLGRPVAISSGLRYVGVRPSCPSRQSEATAPGAAALPARPLRVVRRVDAHQPGRHPSRMVISGRMADVCAELDRLVALEAATARPHGIHLH
jgi:hypothetical protein